MSSEKCSTYELIFKGDTPSKRASEFSTLNKAGSFLLPKRRIHIRHEEYRPVGQIMRCRVMTVDVPDALAAINGLDPIADSISIEKDTP